MRNCGRSKLRQQLDFEISLPDIYRPIGQLLLYDLTKTVLRLSWNRLGNNVSVHDIVGATV